MRHTFALTHAKCDRIFDEYRRYRYLVLVSPEPLVPPPLIDFVLGRDDMTSMALIEAKSWRRIKSSFNNNQFTKNITYQNTLVVYEREYDVVPLAAVWPTTKSVWPKNLAAGFVFVGLTLGLVGRKLDINWLMNLGVIVALTAVGVVALASHWAEGSYD